jgi:proton-translocating NADH-quinone oxidoreductase chain L
VVRRTTGLVGRTRRRSRGAFYEVGRKGNVVTVERRTWMDSGRFQVKWGLLFDSLTVVMLCVVTRVSTRVHRYSIEYMGEDPHQERFMAYLSFFTFCMLRLVTADNRVQMFVGWEGVGLCSYRLINFWYTRIQANKAAIKAMRVNRVGDFGLALGMTVRYVEFGARDYATIFAMAPSAQDSVFHGREVRGRSGVRTLDRIGVRRFVGAVGKSAQLGLHTWLPDAMEGPTPVSALIHAATMVTAGVFLLARCSPRREYTTHVRGVVARFGAMTAFFAGTVGRVQNDRKRVIAYSTCSQLGYMVFACGRSGYAVGVFHLSNHAMFKALLFLGAGSVIHAMGDEQDVRRMGGLVRVLPRTYARFRRGSRARLGFPYRTGFYSKDVILEVAYGTYTPVGHFAYALGTAAAFCTAFYSVRRRYRTFLAEPAGYRHSYEHAHDAPRRMAIPLRVLGVGSRRVGWRTKDLRIGMGTPFWQQALYTRPGEGGVPRVEAEFVPQRYKRLPVRFARSGTARGFGLYGSEGGKKARYERKVGEEGRARYTYRTKKWFFDKVYAERVTQTSLNRGYHGTYKGVDRGRIERLGPRGRARTRGGSATARTGYQTGSVYHYRRRIRRGRGRRRAGANGRRTGGRRGGAVGPRRRGGRRRCRHGGVSNRD